jgi:hypothetical protein
MRQTNRERRGGEGKDIAHKEREWLETQDINRGIAMTNTDETRSAEKQRQKEEERRKKKMSKKVR